MLKELLKFKHNSSNIPVALGFKEEVDERCREIINFCTFTNYYIKDEFYENDSDVPENLSTITGILEKSLSLCKTIEEELYTFFSFRNIYSTARKALGAYVSYEESDEKEKAKMKMLLELAELKAVMEDENREDMITPKDMFKRIEKAKKSMYNFDNYYTSLKDEQPS